MNNASNLLFRQFITGNPWKVRRHTYVAILGILVVYLAMTVYTGIIQAAQIRSFLYSLILVFEAVGALNIRRGHPYWPAYKIEKILGAIGFAGLSASTGIGLVGNNLTLGLWIFFIIAAKILSFEFILRKNSGLEAQALHTAIGMIPKPETQEEQDEILTIAAAVYRHGLGSEIARLEYMDAVEGPNITKWAKETRDMLIARRQKAAELQALGIDVEARDLEEYDL